jgi:hypothetical protein
MRRHAVVLAASLTWLTSIGSAEAKLDILVDKTTQRMLVIQDGYMRYIWPVSTGRDEMATPNGVYTPQRLERNWFSSAYYNSPMPYSIFFHNGYAIHGSSAIDKLGGPASHGCVRLHPHHAALLFDLVQQEGPGNTTIEVTDEARPQQPSLPGRDIPSLPGREIAAEQGPYPPVPRIIRYREPGEMPELAPAPRSSRSILARNVLPPRPPAAVADEARPEESSLSGRQIAAAQGLPPPVPRIVRYREPGEMPELAPAPRSNRSILARNVLPPRLPAAVTDEARPEESSLSGRQIAAAQGLPAPGPRVVRYRETAAMPELTPTQRGNRSIAARNVLPPKPAPAAHRPLPTDVVAEGSSPATTTGQAQQAPSVYGLKVLPASCWSGGASRWRWWTSSQGTPCK